MSFKERLKQAREHRGFTQSQLAELIGVTKSAVTNYETGVSSAKAEVLYKIFVALNVEPNFLFQDDMPSSIKQDLNINEAAHIDKYRSLNNQGQEKVNEYVADMIATDKYKKLNHYSLDK